MKIVVLDGYAANPGDLSWEGMKVLGECTIYDRTAPEEVLERAAGAEAILTNKVIINADHMAALPELKYIGVLATGYNVVDTAAAKERGIIVTNIPSYSTASVAQMVFSHILNITQQVQHHSEEVHKGRWTNNKDFCFWDTPLMELREKKIGLVGLGNTGYTTARVAIGFGMQVYALTSKSHFQLPPEIKKMDLDQLFSECDIISLHCPGPHKKGLYAATAIVLVSVLMGVLPFVLAYQVIAPLVMGESIEASFIILRVVLVLACLVLQALFYGWGLNLSHKAAYDTLLRLRTALQKRFEKLPLGVIQDKGTGTVKKLFVDDVDSLEVLLAHSMPEGIANLMIPIAVYVAMSFVDWKLALLSLASIPISLIAMMTMYSVGMKKMGPYYMAGQKMNNTIIEYINGMEVVKVFNKDADSYERFRKDVSDYRDYTLAWYKAAWPWMAIYSSLLPCTIILTLPVGAWFVLSGWSTLPNLILVLCLSLSIGMPLLKSLGFLPTMPQLNYKISALEQVLDAPELQQTEDAFHGKDDTITYDHVSFAYQTTQPGPDGKPVVIEDEVLHDISFTAKAGQKTALVGESGSGKSTLAKLLIHYYDPQKGSISIGGQKLCDMSLEALNSRISYVAQDQYLFNTSLLENIRLGRLNATDEEVVEAAKKAQCMEFLEKLPQGIHSMAGDAGKMLSGGQRQRISLARAILKDAPIVVLDEATAYADPENEEKMEAAIAELVKGKTLVVIAHKLPAIMNADQICVMDHGKLVATGRHQELIQSCPEYQKLWKAAQDSAEWKVHTAKEGK